MKKFVLTLSVALFALTPSLQSESGWIWPGKPAGVYAWGGEPDREIRLVLELNGSYTLQDIRYAGVLPTVDSPRERIDYEEKGTWMYATLHLTLTTEPGLTGRLPDPMGNSHTFKKCSSGSETLFVSEDPQSDFCFRLVDEKRKPNPLIQPTPGPSPLPIQTLPTGAADR